jgi:hypothetical protein
VRPLRRGADLLHLPGARIDAHDRLRRRLGVFLERLHERRSALRRRQRADHLQPPPQRRRRRGRHRGEGVLCRLLLLLAGCPEIRRSLPRIRGHPQLTAQEIAGNVRAAECRRLHQIAARSRRQRLHGGGREILADGQVARERIRPLLRPQFRVRLSFLFQ